jgi:ferritin-like protein
MLLIKCLIQQVMSINFQDKANQSPSNTSSSTDQTKGEFSVVGVNVLNQNGVNPSQIANLLVYNASVEFTAYYYFTNLRMHCTGSDGESVKGVIEDARLEDLSHFESCLPRIYELGGHVPDDAQEFIRMSGCEFLKLPSNNKTDMKEILRKCLKAEQGAIVNWNKLCNMTNGKDHATYDLSKDILREEIEHESWFLELLYGRPSGHMRRKYPGEAPYTSKHSRALDR